MSSMKNKINPIKIHYGLTKKVKGRYFDIALYHIKYVHAIEFPENFFVQLSGKFGQVKSNNIKIFKRLRLIRKLKFDPKSQWLTKFNYMQTIKTSLQCCKEFHFIGLNLLKQAKRLEVFKYNFPYRLSFDTNRIKDIHYLKFSKSLKSLWLSIDSFDTQAMYKKLFKVLKNQSNLEIVEFMKINFGLAKPHLATLQNIKKIAIMNEINLKLIVSNHTTLTNLVKLSVYTAVSCLQVLSNIQLFANLKYLELNDFVIPHDPQNKNCMELFTKISNLNHLEVLIMELNMTMKEHTSLFFTNFAASSSVKRLEFTLLNISFGYEDDNKRIELNQCLQKFCSTLESLTALSALKICFTVYDNFFYINTFIQNLPKGLNSLRTVDCLFRTDNEFDSFVFLDDFLLWASHLKSLKRLILRSTNLFVHDGINSEISLPQLHYIRLTEEFGRKPIKLYQDKSKDTIKLLALLKDQDYLDRLDLNLNFTDLSGSFFEVLLSLLSYFPLNLKALKLRIIHKNEGVLDSNTVEFAIQVMSYIDELKKLRSLELNLPLYFKCHLTDLDRYQHVLIPGVWRDKATGIIYYW